MERESGDRVGYRGTLSAKNAVAGFYACRFSRLFVTLLAISLVYLSGLVCLDTFVVPVRFSFNFRIRGR
jgi:hypothetical protein